MHIQQAFSILVASGQGQECSRLKKILAKELLVIDPQTQELKVLTHKFGAQTNPDSYQRISKDLAKQVSPMFKDIDPIYFGKDLKRVFAAREVN